MDSAYDAKEIHAHSTAAGHVPIIDTNPRNRKAAHRREQKAQRSAGFIPPEQERYKERSTWSGSLDDSKMSLVDAMYAGTAK